MIMQAICFFTISGSLPMRHPRPHFILLFFLALIALPACTPFYKEPAVTPVQARHTITENREQHYTPETLRLTAKVDYYDGSQNKRVAGRDFIISARTPASLRVTLSSFDKALSTLVTDGHTFGMLDAMNNVFVTGLATPANLAQLLPLYLSAHDIFRILTARHPDDNVVESPAPELRWNTEVGAYQLDLELSDGRTEHVFYAYPSGDIVKITISRGEETQYEFSASDFGVFYPEQDDDIPDDAPKTTPTRSIRLPKTVIFKLKPQKTDVRLRVDSYALDCEFSPQVFQLVPPQGTRVIVLHDDSVVNMPDTPNPTHDDSVVTMPDAPNLPFSEDDPVMPQDEQPHDTP